MLRFWLIMLGSCSHSIQIMAWSIASSSGCGRSVARSMMKKSLLSYYPTTAASTATTTSALGMTTSPGEDEESSIDGFQLTTKTKKTIVFDEKTGRFFETTISVEPEEGSKRQYQQPAAAPLNDGDEQGSFSSTNEMIPTEVLFGKAKSTFPQVVEVAADILTADFASQHDEQETATTTKTVSMTRQGEQLGTEQVVITPPPSISTVERCYNAWNLRDMTGAVTCFDTDFRYQDTQYVGAFTEATELARHFAQQADLLPSGCQLVLEMIAVDPLNGNIGTRWHVEDQNGSTVPLTRGCSFYTTSSSSEGLITSGFRVLEMLVKPRAQDVDSIVASASRIFENISQQGGSPPPRSESSSSSSIIEQYFEAWNNRDMEAALDCFTDDCIYQTEDPVFVDTFEGKEALRDHLLKNAAVLPSSCKILLDNLAIDPTNGNIGTRWHLEISGIAVPNMRGCSMYTTDPSTGLLTSGFDVTEAPIKLPKEAMALLSILPGKRSLFSLLNSAK